ncbi:hypothetical protein [Acanthopleuribacter pedis]|uniref:Uncharacterized protein n=1 Tax=Acanthopleuribacter pedis TaxID=442870 RepID=A0A8J7U759_9BACT|nr:hypothetical protein [Acanthopleuribacter pedis]MBO1323477.1 hypothetical protein [Acanthopleuribacter pedis]
MKDPRTNQNKARRRTTKTKGAINRFSFSNVSGHAEAQQEAKQMKELTNINEQDGAKR